MKFGGHAAAGGLTIAAEDLERFQVAFAAETAALKDAIPGPTVTTDGESDMRLIDDDLLAALAELEPYGQGFSVPLFEADLRVLRVRLVGADKVHAQLMLSDGARHFKGIWFFAAEEDGGVPVRAGETVRLAFTPQTNEWNGQHEIQFVARGRVYNGQDELLAPSSA